MIGEVGVKTAKLGMGMFKAGRQKAVSAMSKIVPGTPLEVLEAIVAVSHDIYRKLARGLIKVTAGNLPAEAATAAASTHPTTTPISAIVTN
jgi:hypothetical protein